MKGIKELKSFQTKLNIKSISCSRTQQKSQKSRSLTMLPGQGKAPERHRKGTGGSLYRLDELIVLIHRPGSLARLGKLTPEFSYLLTDTA